MDWAFTKPTTVQPRFLPYHAYPLWYSIVQYWAKPNYYIRNRRKPIIITELQQNLKMLINICCFSFNEISMKRKNCALRQVWPKDEFWPMMNFDIFELITWYSLLVWALNLVFGRFINFEKGRKKFDFIDFSLPYSLQIQRCIFAYGEIMQSFFSMRPLIDSLDQMWYVKTSHYQRHFAYSEIIQNAHDPRN